MWLLADFSVPTISVHCSMPKSKGMQIVGHSIFRDPGGVCNKGSSENMVKERPLMDS